jgi:hypothetical protein
MVPNQVRKSMTVAEQIDNGSNPMRFALVSVKIGLHSCIGSMKRVSLKLKNRFSRYWQFNGLMGSIIST